MLRSLGKTQLDLSNGKMFANRRPISLVSFIGNPVDRTQFMKKSMIVQVLPIIALLCVAAPTKADIEVCNDSDGVMSFVYLKNHGLFFQSWKMKGWFMLESGSCQTIHETPDKQRAYFSILSVDRNGKGMIKNYPVGKGKSSSHWRDGWHGSRGVQEFFCVKDEAFEWSPSSLSSADNCRTGFYKHLFNIEVRTGGHTDYRLGIR